MIQVKDLCKRFGPVSAIDHLSFTVEKGEILGFLGPNGAGKTTTMRILTGFFPPNEGSAQVAGHDVLDEPMAVRALVGYLPENVPLYRDMRVLEYLRFVGAAKGLEHSGLADECSRVMQLVNIGPKAGQLISQLSKGYRQRVGLAQALLGDPPVLILDEPTIGLDPAQIVEIRSLIKAFAGSKTVILSSHILPEVAATCHRVIIINQGRLAAEVPLSQGQEAGGDRLRLVAMGEAQALEKVLAAVPGVESISQQGPAPQSGGQVLGLVTSGQAQVAPALAKALVAAGHDLLELSPAANHLEEIYVSIITTEAQQKEAAA